MSRWLMKIVALLAIVMTGRKWAASRHEPARIADAVVRAVLSHPWLTAGLVGVLAAAAALLGVLSGVVPIRASSGHWTVTQAVLDLAKVRSVSTHSLFVQAPPLPDTPALMLKGAGHYQTGCYPCHGGPGAGIPPVMAAMTPPPPELSVRIARWKPEELFSIVKHGIKFTGMPAWPAQQRDDEVWAMVAFLRKMPAMDAAAYRTFVYGESETAGARTLRSTEAQNVPSAARDVCARCHGLDGHGRGSGAFPKLAGQSAAYLLSALQAFARGDRHSGVMQPIATALSEPAMRELALYYSSLGTSRPIPAVAPPGATDPAPGIATAQRGIPGQRVPACAECHGPTTIERNPAYPGLAGQYQEYLTLQLELFARGERGGSPYAHLMPPVAGALTREQIQAVAGYYASLSGPLRP